MFKKLLLALVFSAGTVLWSVTSYADGHCEGSTMSDGHTGGKYPQQYELSEYQSTASCKMMFSENPNIVSINDTIQGNKGLAAVADRLPDEPLVVVPYDSVGSYGGTIRFLSNATEAGTSDMLSTRHVNLVRFADDLSTIVPNVAKDYEWNSDFTTLTFMLRKGHKWSNGEPFTARDVEFWYEDLMMNTNIREKPYPYLLVGGEPMTVDVVDDTTVRFNLPSPFPGLLATLAWSYNQAFMPAHFLEQFHPEIDSNADANAQALGFENGWDALAAYYGNSGWTDTPTPMLRNPDLVAGLEYAAYPSLEAYMTIEDTTEGRVYAANPYFHQVDTAGNQLPYIDYQNERYINENEIRLLKLVNGEVDYKSQSVQLESAPQLLDGADSGGYSLQINPGCGAALFSFNVTHPDMEKRKVYSDIRFRQAMSIALDRNEINDVAYYGMGVVEQFVAELLLQINAIKLQPQEPFTWASGWKSPIYCDNRITLSYPAIRNYIREHIASQIETLYGKPDVIAGVATGAIGIGMLVADYLNLPFCYVRPEAKKHGRQNKIEGMVQENQTVVVVEDLISTGKSSLVAVEALREANLNVKGMLAIFSYGFDLADENFRKANVTLNTLSNYEHLLLNAEKSQFISSPESKQLSSWRKNPATWTGK
jgi:orotate phosphoribosyltransferase